MKFAGIIEAGVASGVVTESKYVKGGYIVCPTIEDMEALSYGIKTNGTLCFVNSIKKTYRWKWDEVKTEYTEDDTGTWISEASIKELEDEVDALNSKVRNIESDYLKSSSVDGKSIIYLTTDKKLSIKGYNDANQGYMLVKDETEGLAWVKPITTTQLEEYVAQARAYSVEAGTKATQAGNSAIAADTSAKLAQRINEQTMNWISEKFWWGTLSEYNQLESIKEGSFYFIRMDK